MTTPVKCTSSFILYFLFPSHPFPPLPIFTAREETIHDGCYFSIGSRYVSQKLFLTVFSLFGSGFLPFPSPLQPRKAAILKVCCFQSGNGGVVSGKGFPMIYFSCQAAVFHPLSPPSLPSEETEETWTDKT